MNRSQPYNDLPLLPPTVDIETKEILKKAIAANRQLAELKGKVKAIPNQDILVNGIILQEARLSSEIENIVTTNDELYKAAADEKSGTDSHSKEVLRYKEAIWHGFNSLKERPLTTNLFIELVAIIKNKNIGVRKVPGTKIANSRGEIIYTPPEGERIIRDKLTNLEEFLYPQEDDGIDPLIKLAIAHYQFEAIHPFTDGNGRTGRIINILFLVEKGLLSHPILFLSHYILRHKSAYYEGLKQVTEGNKWIDWILYILEAIEITALETHNRVSKILAEMERFKNIVQKNAPQIYSKDLIEILFQHPYCKIKFLTETGIAKRQTASTYLQTLEKLGVLTSIIVKKEKYYINNRLIEILNE